MASNRSTLGGGLGGLAGLSELRRRLLFVLGALLVFRIGAFIPVPGVDPVALAALFDQQRGTIIDMFNMFSGGALGRLSVALGDADAGRSSSCHNRSARYRQCTGDLPRWHRDRGRNNVSAVPVVIDRVDRRRCHDAGQRHDFPDVAR